MELRRFCRDRMKSEATSLSRDWLERLSDALPLRPSEVFPSHRLLDHIPDLVDEIADSLLSDDEGLPEVMTEKARELGRLRFDQNASVHQLLIEYDLLADVVDEAIVQWLEAAPSAPASGVHWVLVRIHRGVRLLSQASVDALIECLAQQLAEQRELLRSFNRMVSHEIRNPIGTVANVAALLEDDEVSEDARATLAQLLQRAVAKMSGTLESLETLARLDEGSASPDEPIDLAALGRDVATRLRDLATKAGVDVEIWDDLPRLRSAPDRIDIVLMNLVSNAIKYHDPAKRERWVRLGGAPDASPEEVAFRVVDNGIGIPAAAREDVFKRFHRVHPQRDAELGIRGSGLGLSIVADCVRSLGGRIELASEEGKGTEIVVTLPANPR